MDSQDQTDNTATPIFDVVDVTKEFDQGKVQALRGVTLRIEDGEFVSMIGTSGSGKSTLLHLLGSLDHPSSGTLRFKGQDIGNLPDPAEFRAREIGYIFQSFHLLPTFTVEENVQIPMFGLPGNTAKSRKERAVELLEAVGLSHRLGHLPTKLSGGERQRAAIARSLANNPTVLLADEPTGNLDSDTAVQIMQLLGKLHAEHRTTMVLVTHDIEVAENASRIVQMKDGRIISDPKAPAASHQSHPS